MSANEFVPIRVSTLRGEMKIDFNAYVKVAEKFILYCREGDSFHGDQLQRLKSKSLKKLFIKAADEERYRSYIVASIEAAYANKDLPMDTRAEVIQGAQQAAAEEVLENPHDEDAYEFTKQTAKRYIEFLFEEDEALKSILNIENPDNNIAQHGVTVGTLAIVLAQKLGVTDANQLNCLAVGCFIHDFDHFHSGLDVARPIEDMDAPERNIYKNHPLCGLERLVKYKHFDEEVLAIVLQHEELINGTGFPKGLTEVKISPLAKIAAVANIYDRLVTFENLEPKEAVKKLIWDRLGLYPLDHLEALRDTLKERGVTV